MFLSTIVIQSGILWVTLLNLSKADIINPIENTAKNYSTSNLSLSEDVPHAFIDFVSMPAKATQNYSLSILDELAASVAVYPTSSINNSQFTIFAPHDDA